MGEIIRGRFPKGHPRHARASTRTRSGGMSECIESRASKVTPLMPRSAAILTSGRQYSGGTRPRCAHLLTIVDEMFSPAALKSSETVSIRGLGQRSKIARGDDSMHEVLGRQVLNVKADMSCDNDRPFRHPPGMPDRMSEAEERAAFIGRVRAARMARFEKQKPMLTILGLDQGTYKQYETRTPLPWRLIPKFCAATGVEIEWLLTGEGKGPNTVPMPKPHQKAADAPRKRTAA